MKKTILGTLIVLLVSTPCFTQQIDAERIPSLHGTVWDEYLDINITPPNPGMHTNDDIFDYVYFYGGRLWSSHGPLNGFYIDTLPFSISFQWMCELPFCGYDLGFWAPSASEGTSVMVGLWTPIHIPIILPFLRIKEYNKIEDNFIPEETIDQIIPEQRRQGETYDAKLWCRYTTFEKNPPVEIIFDPPDGLTVSNIHEASDYWIDFELEIAIDAPLGFRNIIVMYDDDKRIVENNDVDFEVVE